MTTDELKNHLTQSVGFGRLVASEWHVRFGQLYDRIGQLDRAENNYRRALARHPRRLEALSGLGRLLLRKRRFEEASEIWRQAVGLSPDSAALTFQFSRALHRSGQLEQAASQYLRVVALAPDQEKAFDALEELVDRLARSAPPLENSERLAQAARIGRELLATYPNSPRARASAEMMALAIVRVASALVPHAPEAALIHFNAALDLAPDLLEALRGAALCLEQVGQPDKALAILERQMLANPRAMEPQLQSERIRAALQGPIKPAGPLTSSEREAILSRARQLIAGDPAEAAALAPSEREAILSRARQLVTGDPAEAAALAPSEREAILSRARQLIAGDPAEAAALAPSEREAILSRARQLVTGDPAEAAALAPSEREAILSRARQLVTGDPAEAAALAPSEREAILSRARQLVTGDPAEAAALAPSEREAILSRARQLIAGGTIKPAGPLTSSEREAILSRARQLIAGGTIKPAGPLTSSEREAILSRARQLIAGDPAEAAALAPSEREAILSRARQLVTGDPAEAAALAPSEREAILSRARQLIAGDPAEAAALAPSEREAILSRARQLVTGDPAEAAALAPSEREAILSRARQLVTGDPAEAAALAPSEREAILSRARQLIAGGTIKPAGPLTSSEREAILSRARQLIAGGTIKPAGPLTSSEREAILSRARQLIAGDPAEAAALAPSEREAILSRARQLVTGDPAEAAALAPSEREAILSRARQLIAGDPAEAAALAPSEREAILSRARQLIAGGTAEAAELAPSEREAILSRARQLVTGDPAEAAALAPSEREAILSRARQLIAGGTAEAAELAPSEREAILSRARGLLGATPSANDAGKVAKSSSVKAEVDQLLLRARSAVNNGALEEAEGLYQQILLQDEENLRALLALSQLFARQRRWIEAIDGLVRLSTLQPKATEPKQLLARALLQDGQLEAAARLYVDLSVLEPADLNVWRALGQVSRRLGNWAASRAAWARAVELDSEKVEPRLELAWACHQMGDAEAAKTEVQHVLKHAPDHREGVMLLGRILFADDPQGSLTCWSRLAELDPAAVEPRLQAARIYLRLNRLEQAEACFYAVLERRSDHVEAVTSLAGIVSQRDPEAAVRLLVRWSDNDPANAAPWVAIGRLYAQLKQQEPAEAAFRRALDLAPGDLSALTGLGRIYSTSGKADDALAIWSRLAELTPEVVEPKLQIARIRQARRDPETEQALRAVLSIDPQNRESLRHLAQLLGRTRATVNLALDTWERLADLDSGAVFPIAQRGRLLERVGRLDEAEIEYRRALARDGRSSMALGDLARFYRVQRRWDEAAEIYRTHLAMDPDRLDVIIGLGQCLDRRDRLKEAEELYSRALTLDPDNVTALGYRGRLFRARGQVDGAIADFYRICELEPSNAGAWHELIFQLAGAERESEALSMLTKAEQALGDTPQAWMALAHAAAAALFEPRAIAYFERAIAAEPENATYHARLGLHYLRQGVLDGALNHLLDSRDLDPKNVDVAKGLFDTTRALRELGLDHIAMRREPQTVGQILVPERLYEHLRRVVETITPYEPVPRRVVAISATLAPGGAERQMVNMMRGLSDPIYGLDLALFCISLAPRLRRNFFLPVLEGTGVDVVSIDSASIEDCLWHPDVAPFAELIRHFPSDMVTPIAFWLQEFRQRRPQVVHAWQDSTNLTAVVAALLAGVPRIVLCCRSVRPDNPRRRLRRYMKTAYEAVLAHPSVVLSNNSRAGANDYAEWLGMSPDRIEVVYNGVDFDRLRAIVEETNNARLDLGIPSGAPVLGGVFRMSEEKRPLLWIDVAAEVARRDRTVHFVICGDGPMRDEMVNHAAALGIGDRVHLPGAQANIGSWYKLMDVVMLTSRHEGLPNVLLEAQSLGIPVVAPDVGGMSEVVEQGVTGWTVRGADAESLAERVLHCLSDRAWLKAARERAPVFVRERFSIPAMLHRNLEVYRIPADLAISHDR